MLVSKRSCHALYQVERHRSLSHFSGKLLPSVMMPKKALHSIKDTGALWPLLTIPSTKDCFAVTLPSPLLFVCCVHLLSFIIPWDNNIFEAAGALLNRWVQALYSSCTIPVLQRLQFTAFAGEMRLAGSLKSIYCVLPMLLAQRVGMTKGNQNTCKVLCGTGMACFCGNQIPRKYLPNIRDTSRKPCHWQLCLRVLHKHHQRRQAAKQDYKTVRVIGSGQFGFAKGKSCWSNLVTLYNETTGLLDEGGAVNTVHLDYSLTTTSRKIITEKLLTWTGLDLWAGKANNEVGWKPAHWMTRSRVGRSVTQNATGGQ